MSAFQSFSPVTSKTFCVVTAPKSMKLPLSPAPVQPCRRRGRQLQQGVQPVCCTSILTTQTSSSNDLPSELLNVVDDAVKKFLDRKAPERVTVVCSWSSVKCVPEASSTSNNPSVKNTGVCPRLAAFEFTARHAQLVCGKRYIYAPHR
jgi:hypothetical protein